jgi:hypothetical protein
MKSFEERICPTQEARNQFASDCHEIFGTPAGARVLHRLCAAAHPLMHTPGMPEHAHGNAEVVAALWRYGSASNSLTHQTPTTT